jgi:hypothetical protein
VGRDGSCRRPFIISAAAAVCHDGWEPTAVVHGGRKYFFNLMIYFLIFNFMTKKTRR